MRQAGSNGKGRGRSAVDSAPLVPLGSGRTIPSAARLPVPGDTPGPNQAEKPRFSRETTGRMVWDAKRFDRKCSRGLGAGGRLS